MSTEISKAGRMNMKSKSMKDFIAFLKHQIEMENFHPILCLGKSGIGKTEGIAGAARSMGIGYKEIRLVNCSETDLSGLPIPEKTEDGQLVTRWAQMGRLPIEGRDPEVGILVLDEITSAMKSVQVVAYQLLDSSRGVADYKLPEKWIVVAAGNGPEDGGVYVGIQPAFLSRCLCMRVEPEIKSWMNWAVENGVHPSVRGFVEFQPDKFWAFDPESNEYGAAMFPCPRSWVALSTLIEKDEKFRGRTLTPEEISDYASYTVGEEVGQMFKAFYAYTDKTIDVNDILEGKASTNIRDKARQVVLLQIQSVVNAAVTTLKNGHIDNDPNKDWTTDTYRKIVNIVKWAIGIGRDIYDIGCGILVELGSNSKEFSEMVCSVDGQFDKMCPEFMEFIEEHPEILNA